MADSPRLCNQPPERIHPDPPGAFSGEGSYINFSHPIRCRVLFRDDRIRRNAPCSIPVRGLFVQLKNGSTPATVTLTGDEKKCLMRLHWRYWNGRRYKYVPDGEVGDAGNRNGDGHENEDGDEHEKRVDNRNGDGDGDGNGNGNGNEDGNEDGEEEGDQDEKNRKKWARIVSYALHNPVIPTELEDDELPWLVLPLEVGGLTACGHDDGLESFCEQFALHVAV
ncbi:uncharacterized protein SPPG_06163 [Spizellomyces punctatus DAOM BR117]|uniref:Uncharacterized protein n=1 Tax=Spizellomyces punctatus (strain DAOM BR117) TaxID=645134 RepID=A0A0L0HCG8_SPIPD|nr:uncharacterized protein SPPG_06163 [Spizellomyces punctatus DAOM BR117]KNC98463.1 hypothetical protein SPPG_06163 [Spizellomyces punctatus DAOM BR117]|eukprot:XP_016606503.1 hypothetical protein SPPG_06163 [Spizellomyces punctatus DAOM BR117]